MGHRPPHLGVLGAHFHHFLGHIPQAGQARAGPARVPHGPIFVFRTSQLLYSTRIGHNLTGSSRGVEQLGRAILREIVPAPGHLRDQGGQQGRNITPPSAPCGSTGELGWYGCGPGGPTWPLGCWVRWPVAPTGTAPPPRTPLHRRLAAGGLRPRVLPAHGPGPPPQVCPQCARQEKRIFPSFSGGSRTVEEISSIDHTS
jgi:hypothetical protein